MTQKEYKSMQVKMNSIGRVYRDSKRRMDLCEMKHTVQLNLRQYQCDASYVRYIDRVLSDCDEQTRLIIRNEYLTNNNKNWYLPFYSQSTYYRRKKLAVEQFDSSLNY